MVEHDALFRETVARHFPAAQIRGDEIALGFGSLSMRCWVHRITPIGRVTSVALYFQLFGGKLGETPIFAAVSGYGESAETAIITGACNWTCVFGPVFRAALADEPQPDVDSFDVTLDAQRFRVYLDGLDRAASHGGTDGTARIAPTRARFAPQAWLTRSIVEAGRLPLLHPERPTVLSVFVSDMPNGRVVEVKVDGYDWPGMDAVFAHVASEPDGVTVLLRELAVLVPVSTPRPLERSAVERTLRGLAAGASPRRAVDWPGWKAHGGLLAVAVTTPEIAAFEASTCSLPADYRDFLTSVAGAGAGPGYGLLSPFADAQAALARGRFAWEDDSEPRSAAHGVIALAHAGCGVMWLLVLDGPHRGEVWVDARSSDGKVRRVSSSFSRWYRDWLSFAVRDSGAWMQWDSACCATAHAILQLIESVKNEGVASEAVADAVSRKLEPGAMTLASGGSDYFAAQTPLDPCHGCIELAARFRWGADLFKPGKPPFAAGDNAPIELPGVGRSWFARLSDKLRPKG